MVWGSLNCKLPLVEIQGYINARRYCDEVLNTQAVPHLDNHPLQDQPIFMHDGATPYTANVTKDLLCLEAVDVLNRPSRSPDLNPIENVWDFIKRELNNPNTIIRNVADLRVEIHRIWNDISQASTRHLIHSCRRRVRAVLAARGDFTRYWHFILELQNSALNGAMKFLCLKLDFSHTLNSRFRSLARNECLSDFNEIYTKYAQRSHVYIYQIS